jgi:hypothetical protein
LTAVSCASSDKATAAERNDSVPTVGAGGTSSGATNSGAGGAANVPAERELENSFLAPAISGKRVFSVNPSTGRVAIINTDTLQIALTNAGFGPTQVVALPRAGGLDRALVLNSGGNDASYLEVDDQGVITSKRIATHPGANSVSVSEDGQWALVWTDYRKIMAVDPTDGFQDVTMIRLATAEPTRLTVGFRPVVVALNGSRGVAYIASEPGIDVVELGGTKPVISHSISFDQATNSDQLAQATVEPSDVSFTTDTRFAFVRYQNSAQLSVLSLQAETWTTVPMDGVVTDLDLSEDGSTAVAVVRDLTPPLPAVADIAEPSTHAVNLPPVFNAVDGSPADAAAADAGVTGVPSDAAVTDSGVIAPADGSVSPPAPVDGGLASDAGSDAASDAALPPPMAIPGSEVAIFHLTAHPTLTRPQIIHIADEVFGSVSVARDASVLALYTNAIETDHVVILNPTDGTHRTVSVKSPVMAVVISDDAEHAISLQGPAAGAVVATKKGAFSLIPLKVDRAPKIVATDAAPVSLAILPGSPSASALVTTSDVNSGQFSTYSIGFPALTADSIRLASEPLATGIVAQTDLGFVAQKHPEGRLTLINLQTGTPRTLTGFELAAKVVE